MLLTDRIRRFHLECRHGATTTVQTAGLERVVCEVCGHLTVGYVSALSGGVDRATFARDADTSPRRLEDEAGQTES